MYIVEYEYLNCSNPLLFLPYITVVLPIAVPAKNIVKFWSKSLFVVLARRKKSEETFRLIMTNL